MRQPQGQYEQIDFFDNKDGINLIDSPFKVRDSQATAGQNFNYKTSGAFAKRDGHLKVNTSADTQLKSLGLNLHNTSSGTKTEIRAAGTKFQSVNLSSLVFTNLTEDSTAAGSDFLTSGSTVPVVFSQFNTPSNNILWAAGGGMSSVYGAYSTSKVTKNGVDAPTGTISTSVGGSSGTFASTGTYRYAVAFRKTSTQAISNVALDVTATISATTQQVTITLSTITNIDTTKYDKYYIYRSAVGGAASFTTGDLIAQVDISSTNYVDGGTSITSSTNVPRAGNTLLDNSTLPSGTFKTLTTFKRRLITASGSTVYASDLNKPESWPSGNSLTIPSAGPITSLSVLSFTSAGSDSIDELLCVHKENELWVITGTGDFTDLDTLGLVFVDFTGSVNQTNVVVANGYLFWVATNQVYMWSGTGKPIECGRLIKPLFYQDGDLDVAKLSYGVGKYYKKQDQVIWFLSHKIYGEQKFQLKLDLRLTMPSVENTLGGRSIDGVFLFDSTSFPIYAANTYINSSGVETLLLGDSSGFLYKGFEDSSDADAGISFKYASKSIDCGNPLTDKRFHYVVVWVEEVGTWDLTLDFWTDYGTSDGMKSTRAMPISSIESSAIALWDIAQWDVAFWDDYSAKLKPLIFQLSSDAMNNSEGKSLRLQFRQEEADQPVSIAGFSVIYSTKGMNRI